MRFFRLIASIMAAPPHSRRGVFVCVDGQQFMVFSPRWTVDEVGTCTCVFKI